VRLQDRRRRPDRILTNPATTPVAEVVRLQSRRHHPDRILTNPATTPVAEVDSLQYRRRLPDRILTNPATRPVAEVVRLQDRRRRPDRILTNPATRLLAVSDIDYYKSIANQRLSRDNRWLICEALTRVNESDFQSALKHTWHSRRK
jgi:hypothetical protein